MALLTPKYEKFIRTEKLGRLLVAFILLLDTVVLTAIVFILPSYFYLAFSKDEVLRRLRSTEEVLTKRDLKNTEAKIESVNKMIGEYEKNELRRRALSPILIKIAEAGAAEKASVRLKSLKLEQKEKGQDFIIVLNGQAPTREAFLDYLERLRLFPEARAVISPVTNLLKETDVIFSLDFKLKKEFYDYAL